MDDVKEGANNDSESIIILDCKNHGVTTKAENSET